LTHYLSSVYWVTTLPSFGLASSQSSGGSNIKMWKLVRFVCLSRLSTVLNKMEPGTKMYNTYQLSYLNIATSWWLDK
jgi:hypothetical protein